jgi:hypothetical protein
MRYVKRLFVSFVRHYSLLGKELKYLLKRKVIKRGVAAPRKIFRRDYDLDVIEKYFSAKKTDKTYIHNDALFFLLFPRETRY